MTAVPVHPLPGPMTLDDATLQLYALVVSHPTLDVDVVVQESGLSRDQAADALARLSAARLVQPVEGTVGQYRPAPPDWAEAHLLAPVMTDLYARQRLVDETRRTLQLLAFSYHQARGADPVDGSITVLPSGPSARRAVAQLVDMCAGSYFGVHAGVAAAHLSDDVVADEVLLARRGVQVRSLVPSSGVLKLATRSYVRQITQAGAEVRCAEHVWVQLMVFDRSTAVVSTATDNHGSCLLLVRHGALVERICEITDHVWDTSASLGSPAPSCSGTSATISPATIAKMLASGCTDEVASKRLNMSLRTYRRHVAALMHQLGARTRFQAGLLAREQGLLSA